MNCKLGNGYFQSDLLILYVHGLLVAAERQDVNLYRDIFTLFAAFDFQRNLLEYRIYYKVFHCISLFLQGNLDLRERDSTRHLLQEIGAEDLLQTLNALLSPGYEKNR